MEEPTKPWWASAVAAAGLDQCRDTTHLFDRIEFHGDRLTFTTTEGDEIRVVEVGEQTVSVDPGLLDVEPTSLSEEFAWGLVLYDVGSFTDSLAEFDIPVDLLSIQRSGAACAEFTVKSQDGESRTVQSIVDDDGQWDREILRRAVLDVFGQQRADRRARRRSS